MAIQTQLITGAISYPNGDPVVFGNVRFSLSHYDTTSNGLIVSHQYVDAPIDGGMIAVSLWPNTRGQAGTVYRLSITDDKGKVVESFGVIRVGEAGPYTLAELIEAESPGGVPSLYRVMTTAEYDAIILAKGITTQARDEAVAARDDAQAIAYGPNPVFNNIKVTGSIDGQFPYGTEAAPGVRFKDDPDTGMRRPSANEVALTAGGVDQLKLKGGKATGEAVQSGVLDAGAGKLMTVGAFGWGVTTGTELITDLDVLTTSSGSYSVTPMTVGTKPAGATSFATVVHQNRNVNSAYQTLTDGNGFAWSRAASVGSWGDWVGLVPERGSNGNGVYVRFADGTQICTNHNLTYTPCDIAEGSGFSSDNVTWTFPASFINADINVYGSASHANRWITARVLNATGASTKLKSFIEFGTSLSGSVSAIGRWK